MHYTEIPKDYFDMWEKKFRIPIGKSFKIDLARRDPSVFSYFQLGIKPRIYQSYFLDQLRIHKGRKLAISWARQIGKSLVLALFAFWATYYNMFPSGVSNNTKVVIVSATEEQAKKLLMTIRELIRKGDVHMSKLTQNTREHTTTWFSGGLSQPDNTTQMTWEDGSWIKSFPPSGRVRGETADIVIIDEAAHLKCAEPEDFYEKAIKPTISSTNGTLILSSTPNGQHGFFYEAFDPFNKRYEHEFDRMWFDYRICDEPAYVSYVAMEKQTKEPLDFEQEYGADFVATKEAFFDSQKIDVCIDPNLLQVFSSNELVTIGIDYGVTKSRTVVTIIKCDELGNVIILKQHNFPVGHDLNEIVPYMEGLRSRFPNIRKVVVDDCPQGFAPSKALESHGWSSKLDWFSFRKEKIKAYTDFRMKLNRGQVKIPRDLPLLISEMKALQQSETKIGTLDVSKPYNGSDDMIDSLVMASKDYLSLNDEKRVGMIPIDYNLAFPEETLQRFPELNNKGEFIQW